MGLIVLGLPAAACQMARSGRQAVAAEAAARARAAVLDARRSDAIAWATDVLDEADAALRAGDGDARRQAARLWLPDYTTALGFWQAAEAAAGRARQQAADRRSAADVAAADRIAAATAAIARAEAVAHAAARRTPTLLAEARARLAEARVRQRDGDSLAAEVAAGIAAERALAATGLAAESAARYADPAQLDTWRRLQSDAIAWSRRTGHAAIVVTKESRRVALYRAGRLEAEFFADLGFNWVEDKRFAGDGATPEGRYTVRQVKRGGQTRYYKALLLDYPNAEDLQAFSNARRRGELPSGADIGGLIEIHGHGGRGEDWTDGCIALSDPDMDRLFRFVEAGTPVTIIGADTPGQLAGMARDAAEGRKQP